jgi:hypothetical protein
VLTQNDLFIAHAIRLRQLEGCLRPAAAARAIKKLIA